MNVLCYLFNHKYKLKRQINASIKEIFCSRCKQEFGMNSYNKSLLPMDNELISLHNEILKDNGGMARLPR